ncbi:uncharacterized protein LOC110693298 [Chenopodium quinoa]|uniref:uncharacterized protein LOC110693298 n=1 Tax=Chenopodium quinoa TaxID=63459 RepID=UPI000B774C23|nr:uncharacterized protein LOC110693298 [Chenopodium quinoa]
MTGHLVDRCYKLHGFPSESKVNNGQKKFANMAHANNARKFVDNGDDSVIATLSRDQYTQYMNFLESPKDATVAAITQEQNNFRAAYFADHICRDLTLFDSYRALGSDEDTITIPDGRKVFIFHIVSVTVRQDIVLKDVLFAPDFQFNLIFVHKLCKDLPCIVKFTPDYCIIQGPTLTRELVLGNQKSGLSDNAKELCEGKIAEFYHAKGILHQTSCSDTPQQNRVVERKHKHLLETTRALYIQSKVPQKYWGECVLTAAHIINRMPLSVLHNFSPYQKLFDRPPDISHFRSFGCLYCTEGYPVHKTTTNINSRQSTPNPNPNYSPINISTSSHFSNSFPSSSMSNSFNTTNSSSLPYPIIPNSEITDILDTLHSEPILEQRQSSRPREPPKWMKYYVCKLPTKSSSHWCNLVFYSDIPCSHKPLIAQSSSLSEPTT